MTKTNITNSDAFYDLADQYMKEKRYDEAINLYKKLIEMDPENDSLLFSLAWAYRDSGRPAEAMKYFEQLLEKELGRKVFTGFAFDEMVRIYRDEGNYDGLVDLCERAVVSQPEDVALLDTLGNSCLQAGKTERALEVFELLTRMEPDSSMFFCYLGNACIAAGNFGGAEEAYERAIEIEPTEAHTFYNRLGNAYLQVRQYDRAEDALRKSLDCQSDQPLHCCNLGDILVKQGKLDEAQEAYENAIRINPQSRGAYYNRLGHTLAQDHHHSMAIEMYEKAIDADPKNPFYYIALIDLFNSEGLTEKAEEVYEKARFLKLIS